MLSPTAFFLGNSCPMIAGRRWLCGDASLVTSPTPRTDGDRATPRLRGVGDDANGTESGLD